MKNFFVKVKKDRVGSFFNRQIPNTILYKVELHLSILLLRILFITIPSRKYSNAVANTDNRMAMRPLTT